LLKQERDKFKEEAIGFHNQVPALTAKYDSLKQERDKSKEEAVRFHN
jgi:uncharacterized coiled-coil DUF342 family protein